MVSVFWALGLRTAELTSLKVRDFEPAHGKRTGLLRIRGKNKKQRALFVVDHLFDELSVSDQLVKQVLETVSIDRRWS